MQKKTDSFYAVSKLSRVYDLLDLQIYATRDKASAERNADLHTAERIVSDAADEVRRARREDPRYVERERAAARRERRDLAQDAIETISNAMEIISDRTRIADDERDALRILYNAAQDLYDDLKHDRI